MNSLISADGPTAGVRQRIKQFFGAEKRTSFDLKGEIKSLMFHPSTGEPLVVCDDPGKFTIVMSTFQNYERNVSCGGRGWGVTLLGLCAYLSSLAGQE